MSGSTWLGVADPVVGATLVLTALAAWPRSRRLATLLAATAACWLAGAVAAPLVSLHQGPLVQLTATYPRPPLPRPVRAVVVGLGWATGLLAGLLGGGWPALVLAGLLVATAGGRLLHDPYGAGGVATRACTSTLVSATALAVVLVVAGINVLADLDADLAVALAYDGVVALVAVGLVAGLRSGTWAHDAVADLVAGPGAASSPTPGLEQHLRRILGDPALRVGAWSEARGGFVDGHGRELGPEPAGRARTDIRGPDGRAAAVLVHDPALREDPVLLEGATAAVRLAVANAAMRTAVVDRTAQLASARRRMVEVADVERDALVRRLDDGPRRHLRDVRRLLERSPGTASTSTGRALLEEVERARRELHDLAHGIRPAALMHEGLGPALRALADDCPVPTSLVVQPGRLEPAVEAALYFVGAEGLANVVKHADAAKVRIEVRIEATGEGRLATLDVEDDGRGGVDPAGSGLRGLRDRVEALGGRFEVGPSADGGVRLLASVPSGGQGGNR